MAAGVIWLVSCGDVRVLGGRDVTWGGERWLVSDEAGGDWRVGIGEVGVLRVWTSWVGDEWWLAICA